MIVIAYIDWMVPAPPPEGLASRIGKRKPFESPEQEAHLNLLMTNEILRASWERLFRSSGLSESTYNVLRILRGEHPEGVPVLEIRHRMVSRVPDVTRLVDRLEKMKLVKRHRCTEDRRVIYCHISAQGLEKLEGLDEKVMSLHKAQLGHMSSEELETLSKLLEKARAPWDEEGGMESAEEQGA